MTEANVQIEDRAGTNGKIVKIVKISGQLDESNIDEKIKEIYSLVEANPKGLNLIFDFENLDYMNSKSIGYLTDLYGKVTESGGKVAIAKAKANIIDILQVVGLTQLIQTFDTTELALMDINGGQAPATPTEAPAAEPVQATQPEVAPVAETEVPTEEAPMATTEPQATPMSETPTPAPEEAIVPPVAETEVHTPEAPAKESPAPITTPTQPETTALEEEPIQAAQPEVAPAVETPTPVSEEAIVPPAPETSDIPEPMAQPEVTPVAGTETPAVEEPEPVATPEPEMTPIAEAPAPEVPAPTAEETIIPPVAETEVPTPEAPAPTQPETQAAPTDGTFNLGQ